MSLSKFFWCAVIGVLVASVLIYAGREKTGENYNAERAAREYVENFDVPGIPQDVIGKLKAATYDRFPDSFIKQKAHLEAEIAAYTQLQNFSDPRITKEELLYTKEIFAARFPDSFLLQKRAVEMAIGRYKNQQNKNQ